MTAKRSKGLATRERVLKKAVQVASVEGLEGLTIGRLADATGLSKAGLFAHFGSKEDLQLAVVEHARRIFAEAVINPCLRVPEGLPRLFAMQSNWIGYLEQEPFRGGCFFAAASAEFDGRPGPVRKRVAALTGHWRALLEDEARRAVALGHLAPDTDPAQLAFELHAYPQEANWAHQLLRDDQAFAQARRASEARLRNAATAAGVRATKARRVVPAQVAGKSERTISEESR